MFKIHYCKTRMAAFLNDELSSRSRRRMARFIDECSDCYEEYIRQRHIQQTLIDDLRRIGRPKDGVLDHILINVRREVFAQHALDVSVSYRRYALITCAIILMLLFPLFIRQEQHVQSIATQPTPALNRFRVSTETSYSPTLVAISTDVLYSRKPDNPSKYNSTEIVPVQTPKMYQEYENR